MTRGVGQPDRAVIVGTSDIIAPALPAGQLPQLELRRWQGLEALSLDISAPDLKTPQRRFTIPLPLEARDAIAPKRTGNGHGAGG